MMRLRAAMVLLTGGALMAGCGGDRPPADPEPSTTAPEGAAIEESEAPAAPTAAELIRGEPDLATYVRLMGLARLSWALENAEGVILFAPTDEAFAALPEGTLETLEAPESRSALMELMGYHLVTGEAAEIEFSEDAVEVITHRGAPVTVASNGDFLTVGNALVSRELSSEGRTLVYVIDSVLFPPEGP